MLHPGREHAVGLGGSPAREVVHEHAEVARPPADDGRRERVHPEARERRRRGVGSSHQTLRRGLLVPGGAVDLPGEEQSADALRLERPSELARVDVVVLDAVPGSEHLDVFQTPDGSEHRDLVRLVQGVREPVRVHDVGVQTLGFEPHDVRTAGKALDLHLERRAVPRADRLAVFAAFEI